MAIHIGGIGPFGQNREFPPFPVNTLYFNPVYAANLVIEANSRAVSTQAMFHDCSFTVEMHDPIMDYLAMYCAEGQYFDPVTISSTGPGYSVVYTLHAVVVAAIVFDYRDPRPDMRLVRLRFSRMEVNQQTVFHPSSSQVGLRNRERLTLNNAPDPGQQSDNVS